MMKLFKEKLFLFSILSVLGIILFFPTQNEVKASENKEPLTKNELLKEGVNPDKVNGLLQKIEDGEKLESDIYMENLDSETVLSTSEEPYFRKDFSDGSFIESTIEDVTEEEVIPNLITPLAIEQIGGTQENRTLKVSHTAVWGTQSFKVKIYFPQIGYAKINQAYDWYYLGAVSGVDYRGIYRASETASADAVAIQRLQIGIQGLSYIAKFDFRIRDGRYWTAYSS